VSSMAPPLSSRIHVTSIFFNCVATDFMRATSSASISPPALLASPSADSILPWRLCTYMKSISQSGTLPVTSTEVMRKTPSRPKRPSRTSNESKTGIAPSWLLSLARSPLLRYFLKNRSACHQPRFGRQVKGSNTAILAPRLRGDKSRAFRSIKSKLDVASGRPRL
jgi:hypothetical protein